MTSSFKFLPNPFRFLLITEWVMLASCGSLAVVEAWQGHMIPVNHIMILVLLGLMGLFLPNGRLLVKVLYTALEIGLIFYGTVLGYLHILPTLYLIVVMRSCFLFESLGRWAVAGLVSLLFLSDQIKYIQRALPATLDEQMHFGMHLVAETLVFALGIFFVLQLTNKLLVERQMRQQLAQAHQQLQKYSHKIEELATVQERNRIARDIHDSLGHALTSLNIQMQTAVKLWEKEPVQARSFLTQAQELGKTAMQEVRKSVSTLNLELDLEVVGVANNGQTAIEQVAALKPDVVLMDVQMPIMDGREATRIIVQRFPDTKVLVLSTFDDDRYISDSMRAGAKGYLLKDMPSEELAQAILFVHRGYTQLAPGLMEKLLVSVPKNDTVGAEPSPQELVQLTPREQEVLGWIGKGNTNREIGEQLYITEGTVKTHVTHILNRLDLRNRSQLAIYANSVGSK